MRLHLPLFIFKKYLLLSIKWLNYSFLDLGICSPFDNEVDDCGENGQCAIIQDKHGMYKAVCKCKYGYYGKFCDGEYLKDLELNISCQDYHWICQLYL